MNPDDAPSPRLRGEGGDSRQTRTRRESPSPGLLRNPTSPRKRREVNQATASIQFNFNAVMRQATMIRLRSNVREERPSCRSSLASERRAFGA